MQFVIEQDGPNVVDQVLVQGLRRICERLPCRRTVGLASGPMQLLSGFGCCLPKCCGAALTLFDAAAQPSRFRRRGAGE